MSDWTAILVLVLLGPSLLAYVGYLVRRRRWRDGVPLLEAVIDKAAGIEPPPRTRTDHLLMLIQLGLMTLTGLIFTGLGLIVLLETLGLAE